MRNIIRLNAEAQAGKSVALAAMARAFDRDGLGPVLWIASTQEFARDTRRRLSLGDGIVTVWLSNFEMVETHPYIATARLIVIDNWDHCPTHSRMKLMAVFRFGRCIAPTQLVFIASET